ncbi:pilus assembly protein Flp/PilA [Roseiarcus fermentans]|uniref:Pilus assembly protein Flp/PilA n=1 Tax=Roseiarcus fermentans TaxID=1473586 RepID=A0A366FP71_9HYPH|nr:Flp family type IVb pilin [Roseiarcus fermentans]RBP16361.1 pilus assembly protein Flp/PilA [Roseiarcus fermentans]
MIKAFRKLFNDRSEATVIEYAVIASLIAIFIVTAAETVGTKSGGVLGEFAASLR